ncbi:hypothetical protein [Microcoleus sp. D2_18a_B4]|uniref:hypothetical protein n=1 Tax=Microcoleus sp. D2_18a_B4 TaxID=3055329 RepID=UPI002FD1ECEC
MSVVSCQLSVGSCHKLTVNSQQSTVHSQLPQSGESSGGSSIAPKPPKLRTRNGGFDRT